MGWPGICPTPARRVTLLTCICKNSAAALALTGLSEAWGAFRGLSAAMVSSVFICRSETRVSQGVSHQDVRTTVVYLEALPTSEVKKSQVGLLPQIRAFKTAIKPPRRCDCTCRRYDTRLILIAHAVVSDLTGTRAACEGILCLRQFASAPGSKRTDARSCNPEFGCRQQACKFDARCKSRMAREYPELIRRVQDFDGTH
jgi:hypothetical protein